MRAFVASALCSLFALTVSHPTSDDSGFAGHGKSGSSKGHNSGWFKGDSGWSRRNNSSLCISDADAILIAQGFGQILSNYSAEFGNQLIAEGYIDQSDSVATLINSPNVTPDKLGVITFDTKESFLAGEAVQPGVPFDLLNTWPSCSAVTFRYVLHPPGLDVQGIAVAEVAASSTGTGVGEGDIKWQISSFYGEFNSAVWMTDLGKAECDVQANVTDS